MNATIVPTSLLTAGGALLVAIGLVAALAAGPAVFAEDTAGTTSNVEVQSTITLTADDSFTLSGLPGDSVTGTSGLTAESNNTAGYNVTVLADQADLLPPDTTANGDTIAVSSVNVDDDTGAATALDTTTEVTIHNQDSKSADGGDSLTANYQLDVPHVNADTYSGGLTFTATAN